MEANWLALFISIVKGVSVEAAFISLHKRNGKKVRKKAPKSKYEVFKNEDIDKMIELKKTMSYKQVAEIFNTVDRNVYNHIKKYRPDLIKSGILGYNKGHRGNVVLVHTTFISRPEADRADIFIHQERQYTEGGNMGETNL